MKVYAQKQFQQQASSDLIRPNVKPLAAVHPITPLPRTVDETSRLNLQPRSQEPEIASTAASSSPFRHNFGQVRVHTDARPTVQAKLVVGQRGDIYEQEADRVAAAVMRMPDSDVTETHAPAATQTVAPCQNCLSGKSELRRQTTDLIFEVPEEEEALEDEDEAVLQTKPASGDAPQVAPGFERQLNGVEGRGQPFPSTLRSFFEPRFGYDLGHVRIHNDAWAQQMARAVHARAFTVGHHIVFGEGYYAPNTSEGRQLLAHELTHTIQQGAVTRRPATANPSSGARRAVSEMTRPAVRASSTAQFMLQKADCNFYVYDSTEPTKIGTGWKYAAIGLAMKATGGYAIPSGESIENMLHTVFSTYAMKDCDCIEEIQFLSHGSSGNGMYISKTKDELTANDFNIPDVEKYGDGPRNTPEYQAWYNKLTVRQRRLVLLRRVLCGPDAEVYYRSCQAFQGKKGQEFAKASAAFWRSKVIGHTKIIGLTQPGQKTLKPGQEPKWSESEGADEPTPKKPVGFDADEKPKKD